MKKQVNNLLFLYSKNIKISHIRNDYTGKDISAAVERLLHNGFELVLDIPDRKGISQLSHCRSSYSRGCSFYRGIYMNEKVLNDKWFEAYNTLLDVHEELLKDKEGGIEKEKVMGTMLYIEYLIRDLKNARYLEKETSVVFERIEALERYIAKTKAKVKG